MTNLNMLGFVDRKLSKYRRIKLASKNDLGASANVAYNEVKLRDESKTEEEYENPDKLFKQGRGKENLFSHVFSCSPC